MLSVQQPPAICTGSDWKEGSMGPLASFSGMEEGEDKERLVHTVCACAELPRNSVAAVLIRICAHTDDVIKSSC